VDDPVLVTILIFGEKVLFKPMIIINTMANGSLRRAIGGLFVIFALTFTGFWVNLMFDIDLLYLVIILSFIGIMIMMIIFNPIPYE
jgi:hypothetical protein